MKKTLLILLVWGGAFVAHATLNQSNPSMPGQQTNPGVIGNSTNPGIAPPTDAHKAPGLNNNDNDNADNNDDPYNNDSNDPNDPNSMNDEPGSEGDLDSRDATTPTAQGS